MSELDTSDWNYDQPESDRKAEIKARMLLQGHHPDEQLSKRFGQLVSEAIIEGRDPVDITSILVGLAVAVHKDASGISEEDSSEMHDKFVELMNEYRNRDKQRKESHDQFPPEGETR